MLVEVLELFGDAFFFYPESSVPGMELLATQMSNVTLPLTSSSDNMRSPISLEQSG